MTFNVIDAGARYGLHPTWKNLEKIGRFFLFETDITEAKRLKEKYKKTKNIKVFNFGLYSKDTQLALSITSHPALSSLKDVNTSFLRSENYKTKEFHSIKTRKVKLKRIDSVFQKTPIDFIKLDCEGSELDILQGAKTQLEKSVLAIRSEVCFAEVYKKAALFGKINEFLLNLNFELLNFDYNGAGNIFGKFATSNKFGKLVSTDAVWIKKSAPLNHLSKAEMIKKLLKKCLFLFENSAEDLAIETLVQNIENGAKISSYKQTAVYKILKIKTLLTLKQLKSKPGYNEKELNNTFEKIFNEKFPSEQNFYQVVNFENISNRR